MIVLRIHWKVYNQRYQCAVQGRSKIKESRLKENRERDTQVNDKSHISCYTSVTYHVPSTLLSACGPPPQLNVLLPIPVTYAVHLLTCTPRFPCLR